MLTRSARLYRLEQCPPLDDLPERLDAWRLKDCGKLEPATSGWISPLGRDGESLAHTAMGCHLVRYGTQEKVLPPAVVRAALAERVSQAEARAGRPAPRRDKLRLKDEVLMELLPRAFVKPGHVDAWLDPGRGWLVVGAAAARPAEDLVALLRQSIPGIRITAPELQNRICTHLTHWLETGRCPDELELGDECDLREDRDERATVACRRQDLEAAEIAQHLKAGKRCFRLGLAWAQRLAFTLTEDLALLRIKPLDQLRDRLEEIEDDDPAVAFDAAFAYSAGEIGALVEILQRELELGAG